MKEGSNCRIGRLYESVSRLASWMVFPGIPFKPTIFISILSPSTSTPSLCVTHLSSSISQMTSQSAANFHDFLPTIAQNLGGEALIAELCNGFQLLMDKQKGLITFESLKRNSALLGLEGLGDDELRSMLKEGDMDCDGALNQMEFCVLMFRLSPDLMAESERCLQDALQQELDAL